MTWGAGAACRSLEEAHQTAELMTWLAEGWGRNVRTIVTAIREPLGRMIGNALEVREAADVLRGGGPGDLRRVAVRIAGELAEACDVAPAGQGPARAEAALDDGAALVVAERWVAAQGGNPAVWTAPAVLAVAPVGQAVPSDRDGVVEAIDARAIGDAVRRLGAGRLHPSQQVDHAVGVELTAKVGEPVVVGAPLAMIHARERWLADNCAQELRAADSHRRAARRTRPGGRLMPELPEVETIRSQLEPLLVGRRLRGVDIDDPLLVSPADPDEFAAALTGCRIDRVERRGKYLLWALECGAVLALHLRMTGRLHWRPHAPEPGAERYLRAVIRLDDGATVTFGDARRFGRAWVIPAGTDPVAYWSGRLGLEPLGRQFTARRLAAMMQGRRVAIKTALLNQSLVAGLGNMYVDEALFAARVHPLRPAGELTDPEYRALHRAIRDRLSVAIEAGGASI